MQDDGLIQPTPNFLVRFINSCFANELISAGRNISMVAIASDPSIESSLLPGIICGQIFESVGLVRQKTATNATGAPTSAAKGARGKESVTRSTKIYAASEQVTSVINSSIDTLKSAIQRYSISDVRDLQYTIVALFKMMILRIFQGEFSDPSVRTKAFATGSIRFIDVSGERKGRPPPR